MANDNLDAQFTVRLDKRFLASIERLAVKEGRTVAHQIRYLLRLGMEKKP